MATPVIAASPLRRQWLVEPWHVHGGFRIAYARWFLDRGEDWDQEHEFVDWDETLYPTHETALAAIIAHALAYPKKLEPK